MSAERALTRPAFPSRTELAARPTWHSRVGFLSFTLLVVLGWAMVTGYQNTQQTITVSLNDRPFTFPTHQTSVAALLREIGLKLHEEDIVLPGLDASLHPGQTVVVRQAWPVTIEADGQTLQRRTHSRTVADLLREADVTLGPRDQMTLEGRVVEPQYALPGYSLQRHSVSSSKSVSLSQRNTPPLRLVIRRAVPLYVEDDGLLNTIYTTAPTIGEALREQDIILYPGDQIVPDLGTAVSAGLHVYIRRSKPVEILVDGRLIKTRTRQETVSQLLAQEEVRLGPLDYIKPDGDARIVDHLQVQVVRVRHEILIEAEPIPFETVWRGDSNLEIDQQRVVQTGQEGVKKRSTRIVYEDGVEIQRQMEREWVDLEPTTRVIAFGTKIVLREMDTPEGPIRYWRKIRMLATSYTAATSGKSQEHPQYGITYLGWRAGRGIVAVDPRVISLRSKVYVPGYGIGVAGDTGGSIKWRHIDLGYDENNLQYWYKWVDVYLLDPPPPRDQIRWIIPNWPQEKGRR